MKTNQKIMALLNAVISVEAGYGYWQLAYLLRFVIDNPENINNLSRKVYPFVAERFGCSVCCIEKNINRLIPFVDTNKLSEILRINIGVESLTTGKLIKLLLICLKMTL